MGRGKKLTYVTQGDATITKLRLDPNEPLHWDVKLVHDSGLVLKAHKAILAVNSGFFARKFSPDWLAASGAKSVNLRQAELTADSLEAVLGAIYRTPFDIDADNVFDVHAASNFLEMTDLSVMCARFLADELDVDNVFSTWRYSKHREFPGSDLLLEGVLRFIDENFMEIYRLPGFCELTAAEVKELISRRTLGVSSETDVVDAVVTFVVADWQARCAEALGLFNLIQWPLVDEALTRNLPSTSELSDIVCQDGAEGEIKLKMLELLLSPKRASADLPVGIKDDTVARKFSRADRDASHLFVFSKLQNRVITVNVFDLKSKLWKSQSTLRLPNATHEDVNLGMYSCDGYFVAITRDPSWLVRKLKAHIFQGNRFLRTVTFSMPLFNAYQSYTTRRSMFDSTKFCIPCYDSSGLLASVLLYDVAQVLACEAEPGAQELPQVPFSDCIEQIPDTTAEGTLWSRVIFVDGAVYVVGGDRSNQVRVFDLRQRTWTRGAPTFLSCCGHCRYLFVINDRLCSAGAGFDHDSCSSNFEYCVANSADKHSKWVKGANLLHASFVLSHYVWQNRVYLVGFEAGENARVGYVKIQSCYVYNLQGAWCDDASFFRGTKPYFVGISRDSSQG